VEKDPLQWQQDSKSGLGTSIDVKFVTPAAEIRRYRFIQGVSAGVSDLYTLVLIPPAGKAGGTVLLFVSVGFFSVIESRTWPESDASTVGQNMRSRYSAQYIDAPAGWTLQGTFLGGATSGGAMIVGFERITEDRIKAQYGPESALNTTTGIIKYPKVRGGRIPLQVPVG